MNHSGTLINSMSPILGGASIQLSSTKIC